MEFFEMCMISKYTPTLAVLTTEKYLASSVGNPGQGNTELNPMLVLKSKRFTKFNFAHPCQLTICLSSGYT